MFPPDRLLYAGFAGLFVVGVGLLIRTVVRLARTPPDSPAWDECTARLLRHPWKPADGRSLLLITLGILLLLSTAQGLCLKFGWLAEDRLLLAVFFAHGLLFQLGVPALILRRIVRAGGSPAGAFGLGRGRILTDIGRGIQAYLVLLPVMAATLLVNHLLLRALHLPEAPQPILPFLNDPAHPVWLRGVLFAVAIGLAPVAEELVFRGVALPLFLQRTPPQTAILLSSLLFASLHLHPPVLLPLFVLAAGLSAAYYLTGSLLVPITVHILFNGGNLLAMALLDTLPTP